MTLVALVTGASRGIGAAVARKLAQDGFAVGLNSHPAEKEVEAAGTVAAGIGGEGGQAEVFPADVTDAGQVDAMFSRCSARIGSASVLVNNAAVTARRPWMEISEDEWEQLMAVNVKGCFICARSALRNIAEAEFRSVINIGSIIGLVGAEDSLHYATSKAGLIGFTRSLARELGPKGITVNCVLPGAIETEREHSLYAKQEIESTVIGRQMIQQRGRPEDVASAVSFLADPGSRFITGETIRVDGGWMG